MVRRRIVAIANLYQLIKIMEINQLEVTSNQWINDINYVDETSCHVELGGMLRLVQLSDTNFETIEALKKAIESLVFE